MSKNECRGEPYVRPRTKTGIKPMSENECRGEPCVRPRTKTGIKPMFENELETFAFSHRFANDCCQEGEHKVRPYIDF